ncbi:methyltransferase domain-containing protein [bacterium]|nr:methyltransferase domain-containing protein [bacterium]
MKKDTIFQDQHSPAQFSFDAKVASAFDDMAARSIPGYFETENIAAALALKHVPANGRIYDLGCSTGTTIARILDGANPSACFQIVGLDASRPMIEVAQQKLSLIPTPKNVEIVLAAGDLAEFAFQACDVAVMNYTLQFVDPALRLDILKKLRASLSRSGIFVFSEKEAFDSPEQQEFFDDLYYGFKLRNGYTQGEIDRKRQALAGVLRPLTAQANQDLLKSAGFSRIERVQQNYQFVTYLAFPE